MHHPHTIATTWKFLVGVVVPIKIVIFGVGYVAWMLTAPTAIKRRTAMLGHVRAALSVMQQLETGLRPNNFDNLHALVEKLELKIVDGWKEHDELVALLHLLRFVSRVHFDETKQGVRELKTGAWNLLIDALEALLPKVRTAA